MKLFSVITVLLLLAASLYAGYFYASQKSDIMKVNFVNESDHKVIASYRMNLSVGEKRSLEMEIDKYSSWTRKMTRGGEGSITYYVKDGADLKEVSEYITPGFPASFFFTPEYTIKYTGSSLKGEYSK